MDIKLQQQRKRTGRLGWWSSLSVGALLGCAALVHHVWRRPDVLLVGDITVDTFTAFEGKEALGGAVSYSAAVLSAYGRRACVVTAAGPNADLSVFAGHDLTVVPTNATLTFEHSYTWWGHKRVLRVTKQPGVKLTAAHVPERCRRARTILLGPLTPADIHIESFLDIQPGWADQLLGFRQRVGLMAQGLQRGLDAARKVVPFKTPRADLIAALGPQTVVFLSDVETEVWPSGSLDVLATRGGKWLVTKGEYGADDIRAGRPNKELPPEKVTAVDTNGAGDTFATAYMIALSAHCPNPGGMANWAASRAVTQQQDCKPGCVGTSIAAASQEERWYRWCSGRQWKAAAGWMKREQWRGARALTSLREQLRHARTSLDAIAHGLMQRQSRSPASSPTPPTGTALLDTTGPGNVPEGPRHPHTSWLTRLWCRVRGQHLTRTLEQVPGECRPEEAESNKV